QHGVPSTRNAADGGAFDDLGHMDGGAEIIAAHGGDGGEDGGVAGAPGDDDVRLRFERPYDGFHAHLPDDLAGALDDVLAQLGYAPERARAPRPHHSLEKIARNVGVNRRHAEG